MEAGDEELRRISKKDLSTCFRFDFAGVGLIGFLRRLLISWLGQWESWHPTRVVNSMKVCKERKLVLRYESIKQMQHDKCNIPVQH
jgi:hypothetical protein